jgi:hypothetical protein
VPLIVLILSVAVFGMLVGGKFFNPFSLTLILQQVAIVGIVGAAQTLVSKAVSASAPQLTKVALQNPPQPLAGTVTLAWEANDPDGDALSFDVLVSRNKGGSFEPLHLALSTKEVAINSDALGCRRKTLHTPVSIPAFATIAPTRAVMSSKDRGRVRTVNDCCIVSSAGGRPSSWRSGARTRRTSCRTRPRSR